MMTGTTSTGVLVLVLLVVSHTTVLFCKLRLFDNTYTDNGSGVLIRFEIFFARYEILLCMYYRKVIHNHRSDFVIVMSEQPCSLSATAPPTSSKCTLTRSGSISASCRFKDRITKRIVVIMCCEITVISHTGL